MNVMPSEQALPQGDTSDGDKIAVRAWRAAVLSPFLCPPLLTFYSLWLILRIALSDLELSEAGKSRFYLAMLANVAVWVVVMIIWSYFF
jgi:hypothetical protein